MRLTTSQLANRLISGLATLDDLKPLMTDPTNEDAVNDVAIAVGELLAAELVRQLTTGEGVEPLWTPSSGADRAWFDAELAAPARVEGHAST